VVDGEMTLVLMLILFSIMLMGFLDEDFGEEHVVFVMTKVIGAEISHLRAETEFWDGEAS